MEGKFWLIKTAYAGVGNYPLYGVAIVHAETEKGALEQCKHLKPMVDYSGGYSLQIKELRIIDYLDYTLFSGLVIETIEDCDQ